MEDTLEYFTLKIIKSQHNLKKIGVQNIVKSCISAKIEEKRMGNLLIKKPFCQKKGWMTPIYFTRPQVNWQF